MQRDKRGGPWAGCATENCGGKPVALTGKWVGGQADATRQERNCRNRVRLRSRLYSIEKFPVNSEALDPPREQFLILSFAHPGGDGFLTIFVCGKGTH